MHGCTDVFENFLNTGQECLMTLGDSCVIKFVHIAVQSVRLPETLATIDILAHGNPSASVRSVRFSEVIVWQ